MARNFSIIEKIEQLEDILDLLKLPRFKVRGKQIKPESFNNSAIEKAQIHYFPYPIFGFVQRDHFPVTKEIYSLGVGQYEDEFDYLICAWCENIQNSNSIQDNHVKCIRLQDILRYQSLEKF
ncbi:hypothetical protein K8R47_01655 [archaeon]|nr:hypothetical protein [archaeon]